MSLPSRLLMLVLVTIGALVAFHMLYRELVSVLPGGAVVEEVVDVLEQSRDDLRSLARHEPENSAEYHDRFDRIQALANRLRIVAHNQEALAQRQQTVVVAAAAVVLTGLGVVLAWGARRDAQRLRGLERALHRLASGESEIRLEERGKDHIGTIARMIERTAALVSQDRRRIANLRYLEAWQEGARRQAHELRTPLTVARLEMERIEGRLEAGGDAALCASLHEVQREMRRIETLVGQFATFARLPPPLAKEEDACALVRDFCATFAEAWPLSLVAQLPSAPAMAYFDRAMIRQVLVNLCENSARARAATVTVTVRPPDGAASLALDVSDDGPGIAPGLRETLFEPYVTTAAPGEGMGLGLAICRKILLDHHGELELIEAGQGARFRLTLPTEAPCPE